MKRNAFLLVVFRLVHGQLQALSSSKSFDSDCWLIGNNGTENRNGISRSDKEGLFLDID